MNINNDEACKFLDYMRFVLSAPRSEIGTRDACFPPFSDRSRERASAASHCGNSTSEASREYGRCVSRTLRGQSRFPIKPEIFSSTAGKADILIATTRWERERGKQPARSKMSLVHHRYRRLALDETFENVSSRRAGPQAPPRKLSGKKLGKRPDPRDRKTCPVRQASAG